MTFLAPERLLLLIVVGVLGLAYLGLRLRASRYALRFTNLELLRSVAPRTAGWRRHLLAAVSLLALAALVIALARPAQEREQAMERATIVLAIDTSLSMQATDVVPSRLDVAKRAASEFVAAVPDGVEVGIVAFDGTARLESAPTVERDRSARAIDSLELGPGTAIGDAIFLGLGTLSDSEAVLASVGPDEGGGADESPGRLVVMSDGETTMGRENGDAVEAARDAGVEISAIAYGTDAGSVVVQGETIPVPVNRDALAEIASTSGGEFYEAASGEELSAVFQDIGTAIEVDTVTEELALWFVGLGAALSALAALGSLAWFSRLP
jgi:Ca-activated chloride channel family protein